MSSSGGVPASIMTAAIIVDELIRCGVQDVVVCPGSRSAPLALAFSDAAARGEITLHMRTDERTAAFLALGLAQAEGGPRRNRSGIPGGHHVVPVVMTSGSAVAHCAPAMVEAQMSHRPLMVLSANRPWPLWGTGANQTVDQRSAFRDTAVRTEGIDTATRRSDAWHVMHREVRAAVDRAVVAATAAGVRMQVQAATPEDAPPANAVELPFRGPVHIDVPFDNPLVPTDDDQLREAAQSAHRLGRPDGGSWTRFVGRATVTSPRVLHIAGHNAPHVDALRGVPTIAEPTAAVPDVPIHPLALSLLSPDHVVVTGRPTLHRDVSKLLARPDIPITVIADNPGDYPDVAHMAGEVATTIDLAPQSRQWVDHCRSVDQAAADAVREVILLDDLAVPSEVAEPVEDSSAEASSVEPSTPPADAQPSAPSEPSTLHRMTGLTVAAAVADSVHVGDALVVGASNPVRDLSLVGAPFDGVEMYSNRGASGIDGFLSTAIGVALSHQAAQPDSVSAPRTVALAGDLTFLHDATGLNVAASEPRPSNLLIVVANDQGGGIFEALEPGKPELRSHFERVMATHHEVDIKSICDAFGMAYRRADTAEELVTLLESHAEGMPLTDVGATRSESGGLPDQARDQYEPYEGITVIEAVCDRAHRRQTVESLEGRVAVLHRSQAQ